MTHFQKPSGEKTGELINAKVSVFLPHWVPAILSLGFDYSCGNIVAGPDPALLP